MRAFALFGFLAFAVARPAHAQTAEPDELPIELPPPPPPPPGARAVESDDPSAPAPPVGDTLTPKEPEPQLAAPTPAPISPPVLKAETHARPPVHRDQAGPPVRDEPARWYGWKILIADGGALVLAVSTQPVGTFLATGAFVLTAPSIHLGHKRPLAALGSLSLRIAAPLALNALIEKQRCNDYSCIQPGALAGAALASLFDVVVLAHDGDDPKAKKAERFTPAVAAGPKGTAFFLSGSF